jgi:hypothetical protein
VANVSDGHELVNYQGFTVAFVDRIKVTLQLLVWNGVDLSLLWLVIEEGTAYLKEVFDCIFSNSIKIAIVSVDV